MGRVGVVHVATQLGCVAGDRRDGRLGGIRVGITAGHAGAAGLANRRTCTRARRADAAAAFAFAGARCLRSSATRAAGAAARIQKGALGIGGIAGAAPGDSAMTERLVAG